MPGNTAHFRDLTRVWHLELNLNLCTHVFRYSDDDLADWRICPFLVGHEMSVKQSVEINVFKEGSTPIGTLSPMSILHLAFIQTEGNGNPTRMKVQHCIDRQIARKEFSMCVAKAIVSGFAPRDQRWSDWCFGAWGNEVLPLQHKLAVFELAARRKRKDLFIFRLTRSRIRAARSQHKYWLETDAA
jgi:hypothetical protein